MQLQETLKLTGPKISQKAVSIQYIRENFSTEAYTYPYSILILGKVMDFAKLTHKLLF